MKNQILIFGIIILTIFSIFLLIYAVDINQKYEKLKIKYDDVYKDRLNAIILKPKEKTKIDIGERDYSLKLLKIIKDPPCNADFTQDTDENCVRSGEYELSVTINGIEFYLDSNLNSSAQIITVNFRTDYVIYYIPEYNEQEATFFIIKDTDYVKELRIIVGNYLVYIDDNNKVTDIFTFNKEEQYLSKVYAGRDLQEIKNLIDDGQDLKFN